MGSDGGGSTTSTQTNKLPGWAIPFAKQIFGAADSTYFSGPGGTLAPASSGVAAFSPDQLAAMQMTEQLSGVAPNAGAGYINYQAGAPSNSGQGGTATTPAPPTDGITQALSLLGGTGGAAPTTGLTPGAAGAGSTGAGGSMK